MKFNLAWADIAAQNSTLKVALAAVSVTAIILAAGLAVESLKDPLIIDRGCASSLAQIKPETRTTGEIDSFIRTALLERFNSDTRSVGFISERENHYREDEQKKLKASGLKQTLFVGEITIKDYEAKVDADRLIAVGEIRSAFRFPMTVQVFQVPRSEANPYGLVLDKVEPITQEKK